jgi:anti-sigma regulatory factor (Ser/Thr protein kinase)
MVEMVGDSTVQLILRLPRSVQHVTLLRRIVRVLLCALQAPEPLIQDVELVVGELATNAVRHAAGSEAYDVQVAVCAQQISVVVMDQGKDGLGASSSLPLLPAPGTLRPDYHHSHRPHHPPCSSTSNSSDEGVRFGGWGLPLVHSLCDHVEIGPNQPHGTTVRAEKQLFLRARAD